MRRAVLAVVVVGLLALPAAGVAVAASDTATTTATPSPTPTNDTATPTPTAGPAPETEGYTLAELEAGGTKSSADAPPTARRLPGNGVATLRYQDPTLWSEVFGFESEWQFLRPQGVVTQDEVQIWATGFGAATGQYTVHIVYWQRGEQTVRTDNGTVTREVPRNVSTETVTITLVEGYNLVNISLTPHYGESYEVTMWLSRNGEPVEGARWRFTQRSNPSGKAIAINTHAGAIGYSMRTVFIPALVSIVVGLLAANAVFKLRGRGPGLGIGVWAIFGTLGFIVLGATAYYQIATLLVYLPWLMGVLLGFITFGAAMVLGPDLRTVQFERNEIEDAKPLRNFDTAGTPKSDGGPAHAEVDELDPDENESHDETDYIAADEYKEELYRDLPQKEIVRTDDGYKVPEAGIRPFFAGIFADEAELDLSSFRTRIPVDEGKVNEVIVVDPKSDQPVEHTPAHIKRALPWDTLPRDEDSGEITAGWKSQLVAGVFTAAILLLPPYIGMTIVGTMLGLPSVGFLLGLIPTAIMAYTAEDGEIDFEPAPVHMQPVNATLNQLQHDYKDAKTVEDADREKWEAKAETKKEARQDIEDEKRTVTDKIVGTLTGDGDATVDDEVWADGGGGGDE